MLNDGSGFMTDSTARCRAVWGNFLENVPLLTAHAFILRCRSKHLKGRLFTSNVRNSMLHARETWSMSSEGLHRLCGNDRAVI